MGFSDHVYFRGHFEEISIAKVLLKTKPRRVGKFRGRLRKYGGREKKRNKLSAKYNCLLALAKLERATTNSHDLQMTLSVLRAI